MGNRKYDPEFKREAVNLVVEGGQTIREVERSLGITHGVLKGWVQKYKNHNDAAFRGTVDPQSPEGQLRQALKENEKLRRERDILKKAVAIFSTDPNRYSDS